MEKALHEKRIPIQIKILNIAAIVSMTISIMLMIIYLVSSNSMIGDTKKPIDIVRNHREKLYWTYDCYWNAYLGRNIILGYLREGFGYEGDAYYLWLLDFYLYEGDVINEYNKKVEEAIN